jgi:hypothetical protein
MYSAPVREAFGLQLKLLIECDPQEVVRLKADLAQMRERMSIEQLTAFNDQLSQLALDVISGSPET